MDGLRSQPEGDFPGFNATLVRLNAPLPLFAIVYLAFMFQCHPGAIKWMADSRKGRNVCASFNATLVRLNGPPPGSTRPDSHSFQCHPGAIK